MRGRERETWWFFNQKTLLWLWGINEKWFSDLRTLFSDASSPMDVAVKGTFKDVGIYCFLWLSHCSVETWPWKVAVECIATTNFISCKLQKFSTNLSFFADKKLLGKQKTLHISLLFPAQICTEFHSCVPHASSQHIKCSEIFMTISLKQPRSEWKWSCKLQFAAVEFGISLMGKLTAICDRVEREEVAGRRSVSCFS